MQLPTSFDSLDAPHRSPMLAPRRSRSTRRQVTGRVTTLQTARSEPTEPTEAHRIGSLQLKNMLPDGLAGFAEQPLEVGSAIAVFCPPHGPPPDLTSTTPWSAASPTECVTRSASNWHRLRTCLEAGGWPM
jgi:hypothetical protein